ncbi:SseB family protein [Micromonospora sp. NPDC094482]|uniref:SseB family protein n=1 Tax=unclassified Micromonospora TaxID=2617518 RepID=UPI00331F21BC
MTEWEPATEAEAAMRDALRANDQELYFRILARTELLLPVSTPAVGQTPAGWGTWTTGGRTHVLAFTSSGALRACLGENSGASRRVPYPELAAGWPNPEWWLAVNPGLPVEGYLPAWFVAQLSRGDVRLPGRTLGARARLERAETLARARAAGAQPGRDAQAGPSAGGPDAGPPGRTSPGGAVPVPGSGTPAAVGFPPAPAAAALSRRPAEAAPEADATRPGAGRAQPDRAQPSAGGGEPGHPAGRPVAPRFAPRDTPPDRPGPGSAWPSSAWPGRTADSGGPSPANGRVASVGNARAGGEENEPGSRQSFFEPSSGRGAASYREPARPGDRAAPPSRFGRSDQPFPRRRPLDAPLGEEPTRAFFAPNREPTPTPRPPADEPRAARSAPGIETTQPLPRPGPPADEATRAFSVRTPSAGQPASTGRPPAWERDGELTQPLSYRRAEPAEELPPSIAEPVSGPPAPRRGFTPIVIEGTIIESRVLSDPPDAPPTPGPVRAPVPDDSDRSRPGAGPAGSANGRGGADNDRWAGAAATGAPSDATTDLWGAARAGGPGAEAAGVAGTEADGGGGTGRRGEAVEADRWAALRGDHTIGGDLGATGPAGTGASVGSPRPSDPTTGSGADLWTPRADRAPAPAHTEPAVPPAGPADETPQPAAAAGVGGAADKAPEGRLPVEEPAFDFQPANAVEEDLLGATGAGSTDTFLSTLLLARVLLPVSPDSAPGSRPGEPGFVWRTQELDGETFVVVYTSPERLAEQTVGEVATVPVKFVQLIRRWPEENWSFAVNPGTPVGAKLPGEQIVGLANWAAEVGLGDDGYAEEAPAAAEPAQRPRHTPKAVDPTRPILMQKAIAASQLAYYLERGYDRVSGFVHRANELAHLTTPAQLYDALGLGYPESPFSRDAEEVYVLRWPAHRPSLYRIPYGGQNEPAMRAMEGWVIERAPFRGNGFAPGESSDVVAEFKVDSARLPHGAELWRIGADGTERVVATLDTDALLWREVGAA